MTLQLRPFVPADIPAAQALTRSFSWPHRVEDWALAARVGFGITATEDDRLIGTAMAWPYGKDHAALGLVGVPAEMQGQGIGRTLMRALLDELGERSVILHATRAGMKLYESFGFVGGEEVRQCQGPVKPAAAPASGVRAVAAGDAAQIKAMDAAATGMQRDVLMDALLAESEGLVIEAPAQGFALVRAFGRGEIIGPVVADTGAEARALIGTLMAARAGRFVRLDVPELAGLGPWLQGWGMGDAGAVVRMVRGRPPEPAASGPGLHALAIQAFG